MNDTRNLPVTVPTTLQELEDLVARYPNLPAEAIVKQDILRLGMAFDAASLGGASFKEKDYFIFTFDHVPLDQQDEQIRFRIPEEIRLQGGHFELAPTVVSVRVNPGSPYRVRTSERGPVICLGDVVLGEVEFPPVPAFYAHRTVTGKSPGEIAPVIEWGYLIYLIYNQMVFIN